MSIDSATGIRPLFDRLLDPMRDALTPEVARKIVEMRADAATQKLINDFAERHHEGQLSAEELDEYEQLVHAIDLISVFQAKARVVLRRASQ